MGRFDGLFKTLNRVADPQIEEGDETTVAENPRNWATEKLNMVLPDQMQIPAQTIAEDKTYMQNLPETMAGASMGSINTRFGKLMEPMTNIPHADIMAHPEMIKFQQGKEAFKAANPHPSQYDAAKQLKIKEIQDLLFRGK